METIFNNINKHIELGVLKGVYPGATFAIVLDNQVYVNSVGNFSLYPKTIKNNRHTIYDIASLTKVTVVVPIITKMIEDRLLNMHDKVVKYIPEFKYKDVSIYQLLTHTSGLPANISWWGIKCKKDYLNLLFNTDKDIKEGQNWLYSDVGFIILGEIIENITGLPLDVVAKKMIFKKLNMINTMYNPTDKSLCAPTELDSDEYLQGIVHDKKARLFDGVAGHAGLFSTIDDLVKFVYSILNNDEIIVDNKYSEMWFSEETKLFENRYRTIGWAGGLSNQNKKIPNDVIYHSGFTGCRMLIDRTNNFSFILLSNRVHLTKDIKKFSEFYVETLNVLYDELVKYKEHYMKVSM